MAKASPIQANFNAGEFAPALEGRIDFPKYNSGCKRLENFIPMIQGPARRRSGTRFIREVKDSSDRTWLVPFEFAETDSYILEFGDQYIRFYTNDGVVLDGGSPYEISTPYAASDLTSSIGTLRLRMVQSADVIYIVHPDYPPKKLSRFGPTNWTLTDIDFKGGPFLDVDPDETISVYASGNTGSITITASSGIFQSTDVGSLFLIEEADLSGIKPWASGQELSTSSSGSSGGNVFGILRRSEGKTYTCVTSDSAPASDPPSVIRTGGDRPVHTFGVAADGDGEPKQPDDSDPTVYREGVDWEFLDPGYGWARITGFTSSTEVSAEVISRMPNGVVGSGNTTTRWAFSRWSATRGYPSHVGFFRERLTFSTGQILNFSVSGDFENFAARNPSGEIAPDQAITIEISSDTVNDVQWLAPSDGLLIGTSGGEFVCSELTTDEVFGPGNVKIAEQSQYGSRSVVPVRVGTAVLFIQRAGRKLRELQYEFASDRFSSTDLTVLSEHITESGVTDLVFQQEPHSIIWACKADGELIGFTFNRNQDVLGWHRHPVGGDGVVECLEVIPSPQGTQDDLWMVVRRTINGQTKRYIEKLEEDFIESTDIEDAFFVDSGLTYNGAPTDTLSGLDHLEGEEVAVLADGSAHPRVTVDSGSITLQREASVVHAGLPFDSLLQTMRIEAGAQDGTAQGKTKRITKAVFRFLSTVGAQAGDTEDNLDDIQFRRPSDPMDQAIQPFTGDKLVEWPGSYDFDGYLIVKQEQPLPMTVLAIMPQVLTQDR